MEQALGQHAGKDSQPSTLKDGMEPNEVLKLGTVGYPTTLTDFQRTFVEASREALDWVANHPSPSKGLHYRDIVR